MELPTPVLSAASSRRILDASPVAVAISRRADGKFVEANDAFLRLHGYERDEVIGRTSCELQLWNNPGEREAMLAMLAAEGHACTFAHEYRCRSGKLGLSMVSATVVDLNGEPHVLEFITDQDELDEQHKALIENARTYEGLFANMLNGIAYCRMLFEDGKPDDFIYLKVNPAFEQQTGLKNVVGRRASQVIPGIRTNDRKLIESYGRVVQSGQPESFEIFVESLRTWFMVSAFSPRREHFVAVFDVITERKLASERLLASKQKLEAALASMTDAVFISDVDGHFIDFNDAFATFHKFRNKDECSKIFAEYPDILDVFTANGEPAPVTQWAVPRALRGETGTSVEYRLRRRDTGETWTGSYSFAPIRDQDGLVVGSVVTARDITEQRQREDELAQIGTRLNLAQRAAGAGIWDWDLVTGQLYWSPEFFQLFGFDPAQSTASFAAWRSVVHPDDRERAADRIDEALRERRPLDNHYRIVLPGGETRWIDAFGNATYSDSGSPLRMTGICVDVTERKRTEQALRESEARFRSFFENNSSPMLLIEPDSGTITDANPAASTFYGYPLSRLIGMSITQINTLSPEESVRIRQMAFRGERRYFVFRHRLASGEERWVEVHITPIVDDGKPLNFAIVHDITARKEAEAALQIATLVYQNSSEAMMVTAEDNSIIAVNPAFERITGYRADEVIGSNPKLLSAGQHPDSFYENMWRELDSSGQWHGEIWNRRKNGEPYLEQISINSAYDADGGVYRRIALFSDITRKKAADELIWRQANFDVLTNLPNRRMFHDRLEQEIKKANRASSQLALLFIDLDNFKEINDTLGHNVGDVLLVEAARRIGECVRDTDTVARFGGDEFTVLLTDLDSVDSIERAALCILGKMSEPFLLGDNVLKSSASIGITLYPDDAVSIDELFKSADQAMYVAKKQGRNRYSYFTRALQEGAQKRLRLINDLRDAVAGDQLRVHFQPIVDLVSGRIRKAEALIRWQHPQRGLVSPAEFIPVAEQTGQILEIGEWVFKESARWAHRWRSSFAEDFQISVNKSPVEFYRNGKSDRWLDHMHAIDLAGPAIVVEITEGLLMDSAPSVMESLLAYAEAGVQVAIDDFGTGYSALQYLKNFDIDYLKIDQSFTRNLAPGSSDMALSEAIIVMAHKLGLKVIAEGIETTGQRDLLAAAGCDYGQGYLFSCALPPQEFETLLANQTG